MLRRVEESGPGPCGEGEEGGHREVQQVGVCEYVSRDMAQSDPCGETVKAKWVRVNHGSDDEAPEARCRLVAQELGLWRVFAGTPSFTMVMPSFSAAAERVMFRDVTCAFLYGWMKGNI